MLTRLKIDGLFRVYSYDFDFQVEEDDCITIMTGPNGYGKTTILNLINALYCTNYETFFRTSFNCIVFYFDGRVLEIKRSVKNSHVDEDSDDSTVEEIALDFSFENEIGEKSNFALSLVSGQMIGIPSGELELYMQACTSRYVTVDFSEFIDTEAISRVAMEMKTILNENQLFEHPLEAEGEIGDRLRLFNQIIKDACFADKEMIIDWRSGIKFKNSVNEFIRLSQLSSGEKHFLIQTYELIFKAQTGTLAIVDCPEISLHPALIVQYIDNIKKIQELKSNLNQPLQVIIATHSPELIGQRWDITRDLYELRIK